jgi:hypothetical protein
MDAEDTKVLRVDGRHRPHPPQSALHGEGQQVTRTSRGSRAWMYWLSSVDSEVQSKDFVLDFGELPDLTNIS